MALSFGRKKDQSAAPKKKKRKEASLSDVVQESTLGAAVDVLKRNQNFALPNGTAWIGLLLNADSIGGLSTKNKNDAVKGSIIELITADKIEVVATKAMLEENYLAIIPTPGTLARLSGFQLLMDAPYHWAILLEGKDPETGEDVLLADTLSDEAQSRATVAQATSISTGELKLSEVVPQAWNWASGQRSAATPAQSEFDLIVSGAPAATAAVGAQGGTSTLTVEADPLAEAFGTSDSTQSTFDFNSADSEISFDAATGVVDDEPDLSINFDAFESQFSNQDTAIAPDETPSEVDLSWQSDDFPAEPEDESDADAYVQYVVENANRVVDEEEVRDTIVRRFLSDDLALVVDTEEFDRVFDSEAEAILLEIPDEQSDWLGQQVGQLSRQANAELAQLHRDHQDELRERFVEISAHHVEQTISLLSTDSPGSRFHALMEGAKKDFEADREKTPAELAEQRRELMARFDAQAQSRAEQAAAHARATYEDKHRPKLERDIAELGRELDRRVEEKYSHNKATVLEMRRREANTRMEIGTNRIFEDLREVHGTQREEQRALLSEWNHRLIKVIDENRANDIARAMVLAEQLARSNDLAHAREQHEIEKRQMREDNEAREARLTSELRRQGEEAARELETRRREFETTLTLEKERTQAGSVLAEQLRQQNAELAGEFQRTYDSRISELESAKGSAETQLKQQNRMHKHSMRVIAVLAVVLLLAGVAVGAIVGWSFAQQQIASIEPAAFAAFTSIVT
ncbi:MULTISPECIES: hypothetical protein [unclassified Microbacterium]|uniref:hypothetical protein n=1 Tax=unclassified Microbacterium TaxID=2609290 RepID=UPI00288334BA|nr:MULTISPECIES: hypothetical protein [unclassified Microbacterium]